MDHCCEDKENEISELRTRQRSVLLWVLWINGIMFIVEFSYGLLSQSTALMADSLDMFGDALVYGFSLYVIEKGIRWRAKAGLLKGVIMAGFGIFVLIQAFYRIMQGVIPNAAMMGYVGTAALLANLICLALLYKHRSDDINMKSTWICSRNDIIANLSVLGASALVLWLQSPWPDFIVGLGIAYLFFKSSKSVLSESNKILNSEQI